MVNWEESTMSKKCNYWDICADHTCGSIWDVQNLLA